MTEIAEDPALSQTITSQPIVLLLGAGSSVPLGMPTTASFRQTLIDASTESERNMIEALYKSASARYRVPVEAINLEAFIEFLHELRLGLWIFWRSNLQPAISEEIAAIDFGEWTKADEAINSVRWRILQLLHRLCGDCDGQKVNTLWGDIFETVKHYSTVLPVFTLNYDWTFEKLVITNEAKFHLTDGFSGLMGGNWSAKRFNEFKANESKLDICLFKLHGSTGWLRGMIKSLGAFDSPEDWQHSGFGSEDDSPFEIVYPGYRRELWLGKENWSMRGMQGGIQSDWREGEPYRTSYAYLASCLREAKVLLVVGFAFGDDEICDMLARALTENKDLNVIVIDPGHEAFNRRRPPYDLKYGYDVQDWYSRLHWVEAYFGTEETTAEILGALKVVMDNQG